MPKFRKKPVVIEAIHYDGYNPSEIETFTSKVGNYCLQTGQLTIDTLEGTLTVSDGDWVIKGVKGEYYPCKPDIFEATYEPVLDDQCF